MTSKAARIPDHLQAWITARKRHHLPPLDNADQEPWKLPLPLFIESLYQKRFNKDRPEIVHSVEEGARLLQQKKAAW
jgi:hypothetical protein